MDLWSMAKPYETLTLCPTTSKHPNERACMPLRLGDDAGRLHDLIQRASSDNAVTVLDAILVLHSL